MVAVASGFGFERWIVLTDERASFRFIHSQDESKV